MTGSLDHLKDFLINTPFFGGLDDLALERIVRMLKESNFQAGATVFKEGDTGSSMFVIARGEVVMCRAGGSGHQVKLVRLRQGDFFGETTLIEMQPRPYTAQVSSDATLYSLANTDLYRLYKEDVKAYVLVLQNINRELCRRLRKADCRITEIADDAGDDRTQIGRVIPRPAPKRQVP